MIQKYIADNKDLFWDEKLNNGNGGLTLLGAFALITASLMAYKIVIETMNEWVNKK